MTSKTKDGITPLGKGRFQVRVQRIEARTGLLANRKVTVSGTRRDAERARAELIAELESTVAKRPETRLEDYAASWLERRASRGELKDSVVRKYGYSLAHINPVLGRIFVHALTRSDVEGYIARRKGEVGLKGGNSVLNELRLLRTIAKDTVAEGYAETNWADRIKPPKVRKYSAARPNRFTPPQAALVLAQVPDQWRAMVILMISTGLRWGEVSALHWEDIRINDDGSGEATIKHGNDRGRLVTVKTDSSWRIVPLEPEVVKELGLKRERGLVFPVTRGKRKGKLNAGYPLVNMFKRLCAKVGVPYTTPHGLRRTFNTLARARVDREVVKAISGHSTDVMLEHYSHIEMGEKHTASRAVLDSISGKPAEDDEES
jgi:integrase